MSHQHVENLLIRYRGQVVHIKTMSGNVYEGTVTDVTNDYVTMAPQNTAGAEHTIAITLHSIEAITLGVAA